MNTDIDYYQTFLFFSKCCNVKINYDGQESQMLHTKFRGNRSAGSGEEDFYRVFTAYGHGGHLGHVTSIISSHFHFLVSESVHTNFGSDRQSSF